MGRERVPELFLGLIFVALLLILSILVINISDEKQAPVQTSQVIQNSYNTNSYNQVIEKNSGSDEIRTIHYIKDYSYREKEFLSYSSHGEHLREKTYFDNYKDEFRVYVVNKDYVGGYFDVKFRFCDYYDHCFTEIVKKYVPAKEEVKFVYLDIQKEKYKYYDWEYKVFPEEKE